ncbi:MAG: helix-turn-helix transcriptional regulator [Fimbriimonadaceae bacterium]|nr:helix-turn-helix transcriptional regulator [Fimbriimonadaceae bacterium]
MDDRVVEALKVLADPLRLRLLRLLHDRGETCVCELLADLGTTQSNISSHLRLLRQAGLVRSQKIGKWVFYRLDQTAVNELCGWLTVAFDPVTAAQDRSPEAIYGCCQGLDVPLSLAAVQQRRGAVCDV